MSLLVGCVFIDGFILVYWDIVFCLDGLMGGGSLQLLVFIKVSWKNKPEE